MNEFIRATALYVLDSENITDSSLSFRMQTDTGLEDMQAFSVHPYASYWLEQVYSTLFRGGIAPCLQNYGSIQMRQGRLLAFPNIL